MIKKLKGQGAIEYLLILGAVLVIAAIVVMLVLNFSSKGPEQLQTSCDQAIDQAAALKAAKGCSATKCIDAVKSTCAPCYKLDKYYADKEGSTLSVTLDEIIKTPLSDISTSNDPIPVGSSGNQIEQKDFPYYYKCLTVAPKTL